MAVFARVNGAVAPMEQVGRDIHWVQHTGDMSVHANFEAAIQVLQAQVSITIIGTPTAAGVTCGVENFTSADGWTEVQLSGLAFA
jgi:hypothetical protein